MSGSRPHRAELDNRRKRLLFRSWHRGMREADLILGSFADEALAGLNEAELDQYEQLLEVPDADLVKWITGEREVPSYNDTAVLRRLLDHRTAVLGR